MPQDQRPSPEEILLRLIKEGKSPREVQAKKPEPGAETSSPGCPTPSVPALSPFPTRTWARASHGSPSRAWLDSLFGDLHLVPRIFLFLSASLALIIVVQIVSDGIQSKRKLETLSKLSARSESVLKKTAPAPPQPSVGVLPNKDLFKSVDAGGLAMDHGPSPARVTSLDQILANYALSGIIGGDQPQAVIEDKKQGKTYFLSVGDTLGEIRVVKIEEGKVTVAIGDQQAQLEL